MMTNGLYGRCIHELNPTECIWCKQNQKLRELIEKRIEELKQSQIIKTEKYDSNWRAIEEALSELQKLLEESKK